MIMTMLDPYTRYISEEKYIVGWRHLACRRELAEGEQSFRSWCESTVCRRFTSLFHIALSVERPLHCFKISKLKEYLPF